ncbi:hypothetical protein CK503_03050 [Aliifodinibius salipaludis]|uniref:DUF2339 domain-containing protein n=1 Tax=Fodinibius salipaludis TaxID=2032627 RepID=A0A2A2GCA8_9BACT|nr:DUF2339 domain-containing protein [Aliifodinibius salipaludis]PAU95191.1 hypothetical protein CK503_03050 [Aliifodinibius salipaludis]
MADETYDKLQDRIERLESRVEELENEIKQVEGDKISSKQQEKSPVQSKEERRWNVLQSGEEWLNKVGIALLLIGMVFLFKYSIDQGWLVPEVRSAVGLIAGMLLLGFGLRMDKRLNPFRQMVMGAGIAAFYITGFATFQLFSFMPATIVWVFMISVTLLSFLLSLQQDEAVLAVVGMLGALGTPFMLFSGDGEVVDLMLYFAMVIGPSSVLYIKKEWQSLLWSIAVGGMLVLAAAVITNLGIEEVTFFEQWIMFGGVMVWAGVSWLIPVFKNVQDRRSLQIDSDSDNIVGSSTHIWTLCVPVIGLLFSIGIFEWTTDQSGLASMVMAVLGGGGLYLVLKHYKLPGLAFTHAFLGFVLATAGLFMILEGNVLFAVLVVELIALRYLAYQTGDKKISVGSHLLFGITVWWLINRLEYSEAASYLLNLSMLLELTLILAGGLWIPQYLRKKNIRNIYHVLSHLLLLYWLYQKLIPFENGQAWVSLVWGLYAILLIVLGLWRFGKQVRMAGLLTMLVVVIKLFLIDLAQLQAIWRILLFMGFGSVLLLVGYLIQSKVLEKSS